MEEKSGPMTKYPAIPGFEIISYIDEGAFARVFKARQISIDREVALKVGKNVDNWSNSLTQEVQRLAKLNHPNIVTIFDADVVSTGTSSPLPYIAMELLNVGSLEETFIDIRTQRTLRQNLQTFLELLDALLYAHRLGVYHCDLHAGNLVVTHFGERYRVKIADFGFPSSERGRQPYRALEDVKQMRSLFWKYFFFPHIARIIDKEEFSKLDLKGMFKRVSELASFRLHDKLLEYEEGYVGATSKIEREDRLRTIALAYVLDHPMKKNIDVRIQPWLSADVVVEDLNDKYVFLFYPPVTTEASGYILFLLSLSEIFHSDYRLLPKDSLLLNVPDSLKHFCEDFLHAWGFLQDFKDFEHQGYLTPTVLHALPNVFTRDMVIPSSSDNLFKLIVYKSILMRYLVKGLELREDTKFFKAAEKILGLAYAISRLPWSQLFSPERMRRFLQAIFDGFLDNKVAVILSDTSSLDVIEVAEIEGNSLKVDFNIVPNGSEAKVTWEEKGNTVHISFTISKNSLGILWALLELEKCFRLPASQFFDYGNISLLARYGIGIFIRIGESVFHLVDRDGKSLELLKSSVVNKARVQGQDVANIARTVANDVLDRERAYYDRYMVICPSSYKDKNYENKYHKGVASYGMAVHAEREKTEALRRLDVEWFQATRRKILDTFSSEVNPDA